MIASANGGAIWTPNPGFQVAFLECPFFEAIGEGNRGGGKTEVLLVDYLQHVGPIRGPGHRAGFGPYWRGILFRRRLTDLRDVIKKSHILIPRIFPGARFRGGNEPEWLFPWGESLLFRPLEYEKDFGKYQGHEYPWIGFEELTNWASDSLYRQMMTCCRSSQPGMPYKIRSTTNPAGPGHGWVKDRFALPIMTGRRAGPVIRKPGEKPRVAIHSDLKENVALLRGNPDYQKQILMGAKSEAQRRAWEFGDWDIVQGGMFSDVWKAKYHVIPNIKVPSEWRMDRSFDWGSSHPFSVGWWAISDGSDLEMPDGSYRSTVKGDLFRVYEWYGWNGRPNEGCYMLARNIAAGIVERELAWGLRGRIKPGPADASIFKVENGVCIANDMAAPVRIEGRVYPGVKWVAADKSPGSRKNGWELVRGYLNDAVPVDNLPRERPGLFICERCVQTRRVFPATPRDLDKDPDDVDTNSEDHIQDEIRYRVRFQGQRGKSGTVRGLPS